MTDPRKDLGTALSVARVGLGAATWIAPGMATRLLARRGVPAASLPFVLRLFGVRDFTMGLGYFNATPEQQDRILLLGMVADGADAAAALVAQRRGHLPARLATPFALTALCAVAAGAAARRP